MAPGMCADFTTIPMGWRRFVAAPIFRVGKTAMTESVPRLMLSVLLALAVCAQGCSVRQMAANSIGDALAGGGDAYASDDDIDLIGAAMPFGLKTIESLLGTVPEHRGLLLAAARGFTQYAYVWVQTPAEEMEERDVRAAYAQHARAAALPEGARLRPARTRRYARGNARRPSRGAGARHARGRTAAVLDRARLGRGDLPQQGRPGHHLPSARLVPRSPPR